MMFGEPETPVFITFGMACQIKRITERLRRVAPKVNGRKIKDG